MKQIDGKTIRTAPRKKITASMAMATRLDVRAFCLLLASWIPLTGGAETDCRKNQSVIKAGETLIYTVYYTLAGAHFKAGEVKFECQLSWHNQQPVYHIRGVGHTFPAYDWFYKVRDVYETWLDTLNLRPLRFARQVQEGSYRTHDQVTFDTTKLLAQSLRKKINVPVCVQDVLSAIYYARKINYRQFKSGDKLPLSLYLEDQVYPIYLRYLGPEMLKIRTGHFRTLKFKPLLIKGTIFNGGEEMTVWVSDDANKIPILIETPILVGRIRVLLTGYRQLRHPSSAILQWHP